MIILIVLVTLVLVCVISSTAVLYSNWKYYKSTFNTLKVENFEKVTDGYSQVRSRDGQIIWFTNDNSFKLKKNIYIHNHIPTYFDPYSLYWLIKYKKWFNTNCKHLTYK